MGRRSRSTAQWRQRQRSDPYLERAAREGWRSRAVFKLEQIQSRAGLLRAGMTCVDLGASPGGWSQFAARIVGPAGRVWALDREPMDPIEGVTFVRGDFTDPQGLAALRAALGQTRIDLVMSDMAPNISGHRVVDQPRAMHLAEAALAFASEVLDEGGGLLVKVFQGEGFEEFVAAARRRFETARVMKPRASRPESREMYVLARTYGM
ncbi:MAG: RlmE family RNA methyltransferase [Rhodospirillaceae bacterium]|nr:RlmE family RNA methyltransferase [Rhodospirillaceae bacterium]